MMIHLGFGCYLLQCWDNPSHEDGEISTHKYLLVYLTSKVKVHSSESLVSCFIMAKPWENHLRKVLYSLPLLHFAIKIAKIDW